MGRRFKCSLVGWSVPGDLFQKGSSYPLLSMGMKRSSLLMCLGGGCTEAEVTDVLMCLGQGYTKAEVTDEIEVCKPQSIVRQGEQVATAVTARWIPPPPSVAKQ